MSKNYEGFDTDFGFDDDELEFDLDFDTAVDMGSSFFDENETASEHEIADEIVADEELNDAELFGEEKEIKTEPAEVQKAGQEISEDFATGFFFEPDVKKEITAAPKPEIEVADEDVKAVEFEAESDDEPGITAEEYFEPEAETEPVTELVVEAVPDVELESVPEFVNIISGNDTEQAEVFSVSVKSESHFLDDFFDEIEETYEETEHSRLEEADFEQGTDSRQTEVEKTDRELPETEKESVIAAQETLTSERENADDTAGEAVEEIEVREDAGNTEEFIAEEKDHPEKNKAKSLKKAKKAAGSFVKELVTWTLIFAVALVGICVINLYVLRPSVVSGHSMDPTLSDGETIVLSRLPYILGDIERGDIVVIDRQINRARTFKVQFKEMLRYNAITQSLFFEGKDEDVFWVKRIIGIEGDVISFEDNKVYLNGEELKEDYILEQNVENYPNGKSFTVGEGEVFVMGDNRNNSTDSRAISNPIMVDHIVGKVVS